jgi:ParB family chromosome partitioning protein
MQFKELSVRSLQADPNQPRKEFPEQELSELAASLLRVGQLVPIIVVMIGNELGKIIDGERRWRAAQLANIPVLRAMVLEREPEPSDLCDLQLTINDERQALNPLDLMQAYKRLMTAKSINASELAKLLNKSKATITRILALDRLSDDEKRLVADGKLGSAGAYAITRMDEATRRDASVKGEDISRAKLEKLAKRPRNDSSPKLRNLRCELPRSSISIRASKLMTVDELIEDLGALVRACKQAKSQRLDMSTMSLMLRDKAQARQNPVTEEAPCLD